MPIRDRFRLTAVLLLACGAVAATGPAAARDAGEERVEKRIIIRGSGDGPEDLEWKFIELDGEGRFGLLDAERGYLGVGLVDITPELRTHFGAPAEAGVLVSKVEADSPAARAGLRVGDILGAIDGESVRTASAVSGRIGSRQEGDVAVLEIWRDGKMSQASATLEKRRRPQIEIGRLLRPVGEAGRFEAIEPLPQGAIAIDVEKIDGAVREMVERMRTPEWEERLLEMRQRREGLQGRISELEKRLAELEKRLSELPE